MSDTTNSNVISSANPTELYELGEWDAKTMVTVFAGAVAKFQAIMSDESFSSNAKVKLPEIRDEVAELYKFGVEVNRIGRELREQFDTFVKLMYELEVFTTADCGLIHVPEARKGAGRTKMTAEERIKAAQKRLLKD